MEPFQVRALPAPSTATQKLADGHDTEMGTPYGSIFLGNDQVSDPDDCACAKRGVAKIVIPTLANPTRIINSIRRLVRTGVI